MIYGPADGGSDVVPSVYSLQMDANEGTPSKTQQRPCKQRRGKLNRLSRAAFSSSLKKGFLVIAAIMWETFTAREM